MPNRIDHFAAMRGEPQPIGEPPEGSPTVTPDLIEHLVATFPVVSPLPPQSQDEAVAALSALSTAYGEQRVLAYLRNLVRAS